MTAPHPCAATQHLHLPPAGAHARAVPRRIHPALAPLLRLRSAAPITLRRCDPSPMVPFFQALAAPAGYFTITLPLGGGAGPFTTYWWQARAAAACSLLPGSRPRMTARRRPMRGAAPRHTAVTTPAPERRPPPPAAPAASSSAAT